MQFMATDRGRISPLIRNAMIAIGVLIAVAILGGLALWAMPAVLTRHPSEGMTAAEQLKAANDVRAPLVAFFVAVGAAGTLWFTAHTYILNREGHVTDRYTKAVSQLGDASSPVRVGGIYALERIANDSKKDRNTIVHVLESLIRERSKFTRARQDEPPEDVKAGLRAASRVLRQLDTTLDLHDADLRNCDLSGIPDNQVMLPDEAKLKGATRPRRP
jgi:hypothetical protein